MPPHSDPSTGTPADDPAELVTRLVTGDSQAEELLLERYSRPVSLLLQRHTGGRPEAEDLFQETFRLALEKLRQGELRDPSRLPGFLASIARNLAIEHYRKAARRRTEANSEVVERSELPSEPDRSTTLDRLLLAEQAATVRRVIGELGTERDRELLLRYYIAEEDKDALCAEFGLTSLQFNRTLHRARQRFKQLYVEHHAAADSGIGASTATLLLGAIILVLVTLSLQEGRAMPH